MRRFKETRDEISQARSSEQVMALVRVCMAELPPSDRARLPVSVQAALGPAHTIADAAVDLLRSDMQFSGDADTANLLHEIAETFATASARLSKIQEGR